MSNTTGERTRKRSTTGKTRSPKRGRFQEDDKVKFLQRRRFQEDDKVKFLLRIERPVFHISLNTEWKEKIKKRQELIQDKTKPSDNHLNFHLWKVYELVQTAETNKKYPKGRSRRTKGIPPEKQYTFKFLGVDFSVRVDKDKTTNVRVSIKDEKDKSTQEVADLPNKYKDNEAQLSNFFNGLQGKPIEAKSTQPEAKSTQPEVDAYREGLFHAPFFIAQSLKTGQKFEEAKTWYEYIFDPTEVSNYWKFLPFLAVDIQAIITSGDALSTTAEIIGIYAQHERTVQDWELQKSMADSDVKQITAQIEGAKQQEIIAQQEIKILEKEIEQNESIKTFMKEKFTNAQLYQWMVSKLSGMYYQTYQMAYDMAKAAEKAFEFERGMKESEVNFINGIYWDSQKKGLLAGESLGLDLDRMEKAYIESDRLVSFCGAPGKTAGKSIFLHLLRIFVILLMLEGVACL